jgi:hypothetical protein
LATKNKSQILAKEKTGEATRESTLKAVPTQNFWTFELAAEPSSAVSFEPTHVRYSISKLIEDIRKTLSTGSTLTIRGLIRVFEKLDYNKNH